MLFTFLLKELPYSFPTKRKLLHNTLSLCLSLQLPKPLLRLEKFWYHFRLEKFSKNLGKTKYYSSDKGINIINSMIPNHSDILIDQCLAQLSSEKLPPMAYGNKCRYPQLNSVQRGSGNSAEEEAE